MHLVSRLEFRVLWRVRANLGFFLLLGCVAMQDLIVIDSVVFHRQTVTNEDFVCCAKQRARSQSHSCRSCAIKRLGILFRAHLPTSHKRYVACTLRAWSNKKGNRLTNGCDGNRSAIMTTGDDVSQWSNFDFCRRRRRHLCHLCVCTASVNPFFFSFSNRQSTVRIARNSLKF